MQTNINQDYIYVVLVKALTGLGSLARTFSKYEYTHIAISLNENLNEFITFSRRKHHSPFNCGFMVETIDCYAFGNNKEVKLKVFKIPTNKENIKKIKEYIDKVSSDKDYIFNIVSMATMPIFHGISIYKAHNCMTFTNKIIEMTNNVTFDKPYYKYDIKAIDNLLSNYFYKEDYFKKDEVKTHNYMDKVSIFTNLKYALILFSKLFYRLIFKGKNND